MIGGFGFDCPAGDGCGGNDDCQSGVCCLGNAGHQPRVPVPRVSPATRTNAWPRPVPTASINGKETDQDCGGGTCPKCTTGQTCIAATDCTSGVCAQSICAAASCSDHVKNGTETDQDCGGGCPACADGLNCTLTSDCGPASACKSGKCASTCGDGLPDGNETATDCGGGICSACADGLPCLLNRDCGISSTCTGLVCTAACANGTQDGQETDTDCGGGLRDVPRLACKSTATAGRAASASRVKCTPVRDGTKDGQETDTDCGGGTCGMRRRQACKVNGDCGATSVCKSQKCTAQCADGTKDGQETDTDCGGPTCAGCTSGNNCNVNGDCASPAHLQACRRRRTPASDRRRAAGARTAPTTGSVPRS